MARGYQNPLKDLKSALKERIAPVYYLPGDEAYFRRRATEILLARIVDPAMRAFNFSLYYGDDLTGRDAFERFTDSLRQPPMLAGRRVVLLHWVDRLRTPSFRDELIAMLKSPFPDTVAIITTLESPEGTAAWHKKLKGLAATFEFTGLYENQVPSFLADVAEEMGLDLQSGVSNALIRRVGTSPSALVSAIEVLALSVSPKKEIASGDIPRYLAAEVTEDKYDLTKAVGFRSFTEAERITRHCLADDPEFAFSALRVLNDRLLQLYFMRQWDREGVPAMEIITRLRMNPYIFNVVQNLPGQSAKWSLAELRTGITAIGDFETALKTESYSPTRTRLDFCLLLRELCG